MKEPFYEYNPTPMEDMDALVSAFLKECDELLEKIKREDGETEDEESI